MSLMGSLGLDQVQADPNALPDGKWPGVVFKSEYVYSKPKNTIFHVITYRVTDGTHKGAERAEFFTIGVDPVYTNNGDLVSITPTMAETQKPWYKKRFVDLGIPEEQVVNTSPADLVGRLVTFGTKKNGEYINISFVEVRSGNNDNVVTGPDAAADATVDQTIPF